MTPAPISSDRRPIRPQCACKSTLHTPFASKRDFVVEIAARPTAAATAAGRDRAGRGGSAAAHILLVVVAAATATAAALAAGAVQHRQLAPETLQHNLGRVPLRPLLVGPFARLQRALDIDFRALAEEFL